MNHPSISLLYFVFCPSSITQMYYFRFTFPLRFSSNAGVMRKTVTQPVTPTYGTDIDSHETSIKALISFVAWTQCWRRATPMPINLHLPNFTGKFALPTYCEIHNSDGGNIANNPSPEKPRDITDPKPKRDLSAIYTNADKRPIATTTRLKKHLESLRSTTPKSQKSSS
ncbi:hypothetical protein KFU94_37925 [Chloroflexi bacterium TSY]|nr:hypothetical protein [Chloroflexi bacterium TSY]